MKHVGLRTQRREKYLTADHMWYYPPPDAFARLVAYANQFGDPGGHKPYFSLDGNRSMGRQDGLKCVRSLIALWALRTSGVCHM